MQEATEKNKQWCNKWWGMIFLFVFAVIIIYVGAFIYETVLYFEETYATNSDFTPPALFDPRQNQQVEFNQILNYLAISHDDPYLGNLDAPIIIVEFSDFQCPYCLQMRPVLQAIQKDYAESVKLIYRDFPYISNHPQALQAAEAGQCANDQGRFWQYHDQLFLNQDNLTEDNLKKIAANLNLNTVIFNQCFDSKQYENEVLNDLQDGLKLKISGTPTLFIISQESATRVSGAISYSDLAEIINQMLNKL